MTTRLRLVGSPTPVAEPACGDNDNKVVVGAVIEQHQRWMERRGLSPATIDRRVRCLRIFDAEVGLYGAVAEEVEMFLDGRNLGAKARYGWVSHLHQFYAWAIDHGHLSADPTRQVIRPKQRQNLPRPIATGDLVTALQMAGPTMRCWVALGAFAGLRCKEIAGLHVDDLLWDDGLLFVRDGKGGKQRTVPMHDQVADALHAVTLPSRGACFRRPRGGPYPAAQVSREGNLFFASLGIPATMHQLRHWFGTHVQRATGDLRTTQELMGHASPTTTAIYTAYSQEKGRRAVSLLAIDSAPSVLSEWAAS